MDAERREKRARLLGLLEREGLDGVLLGLPGNLAWYGGGGRSYVLLGGESGVADLLVAPEGDVLFTDAIEAERLAEEEFPGLDAEIRVRPWATPRLDALPRGDRLGSDEGLPGCADAAALLDEARRELTGPELERYRALGRDAAEAFTETIVALAPETSEFAAGARLTAALLEREIETMVLLVAGQERLPLRRHPLPTAEPLGARAMLVAGARRHGLIVSLTRFVAFEPLTPADDDAFARLLRVESAFLAGTRPGRRLGEVFAEGIAAYADHGFAADEWTRHHQGGPTGYFGRDEFANAASDSPVVACQAFAWNPSAPGFKTEDTVVTGEGGVEVLTVDPAWPTTEVDGVARPLILERA
ncbi:MAG TPA: M24 family metallopeptidase [Gaiellaceae bacterium]|nr:M24 family metallopeptidase [Gaiellaceae bacterium]